MGLGNPDALKPSPWASFVPAVGRWGKAGTPAWGCLEGMLFPHCLPKGRWGCWSHRGGPLVLHGAAEEPAAWQAVECPVLAWLSFTGTSLSPTNHPNPGALERTLPAAGLALGHLTSPRGEQDRRAEGLSPSHLVLPDVAQPLSCCCDPPAARAPTTLPTTPRQSSQALGTSPPIPTRWLCGALQGVGRPQARHALGYWFIELLQGTAWSRWDIVIGTFSYCGGGWQEGPGQDEGSLCLLCPLQATVETLCSFGWDLSGTSPTPDQQPRQAWPGGRGGLVLMSLLAFGQRREG